MEGKAARGRLIGKILRRRPSSPLPLSRAPRGLQTFCRAGMRLVPLSRQVFSEAAAMTRQSARGLRASDALHLAAALEAGVMTIATLDTVMARNAKRLKLKTVEFQ